MEKFHTYTQFSRFRQSRIHPATYTTVRYRAGTMVCGLRTHFAHVANRDVRSVKSDMPDCHFSFPTPHCLTRDAQSMRNPIVHPAQYLNRSDPRPDPSTAPSPKRQYPWSRFIILTGSSVAYPKPTTDQTPTLSATGPDVHIAMNSTTTNSTVHSQSNVCSPTALYQTPGLEKIDCPDPFQPQLKDRATGTGGYRSIPTARPSAYRTVELTLIHRLRINFEHGTAQDRWRRGW